MKTPLNQALIRKAMRHLKSSDKILSALIKKHGPCTIRPDLNNPFHALVSSIISQQLSSHAARAIKGRFLDLLGTSNFTPDDILNIPLERFRHAGLSRAKIGYICAIALEVRNGELDFASMAKHEDEDVITKLNSLSGVGRWTAEMFLIFGLGRPDVLSVYDAGLRKAFKITYNLQQLPSPTQMISIGEPWRPFRSVASWYLWRVVD
jgi:DNA-3-methyladenine glycosylase II